MSIEDFPAEKQRGRRGTVTTIIERKVTDRQRKLRPGPGIPIPRRKPDPDPVILDKCASPCHSRIHLLGGHGESPPERRVGSHQ